MEASLLNTIRTRPRFVYQTSLSKEEYLSLLQEYFDKKKKLIGGYITSEMCVFRIREAKDSIWSPCLQLRVEWDDEEKLTHVRGLFGPRPEIWTMFMFLYFGFLTFAILLLSFYLASFSFGAMPILLYSGLFFLLLVFAMFLTSKFGQIATKNQMRLLKTFILMVIKNENVKDLKKKKI